MSSFTLVVQLMVGRCISQVLPFILKINVLPLLEAGSSLFYHEGLPALQMMELMILALNQDTSIFEVTSFSLLP